MADQERPKRKYHSKRREEQARETRRRILAAARELFTKYGYAGATVEAIAQEAGVSSLTIFATFGNKRSILAGLIEVSVGGDDQPIPLLERPGPQAVLQEKDPVRQIHKFAKDITNILERVAPIFDVMRTAAKTEPEIAEMLESLLSERFYNLGRFVQVLAANTSLRAGIDETGATEIVWAIASPEIYRLLTDDRDWSKAQFAQWLGDTLARLLLP